MLRQFILNLLVGLGLTVGCYGQSLLIKSEKLYQENAYAKVIRLLEKHIDNDKLVKDEVALFLADSYFYNGDFEKASIVYPKIFQQKDSIDIDTYFRYGMSLKSVGKLKESKEILAYYYKNQETDLQHEVLGDNLKETNLFKVKHEKTLNSKYSDFGIAFQKDGKVIFSSSRNLNSNKEKYKWNNQPFLDLYRAELVNNNFENIEPLSESINTKYHESSVTITKDGKTMYFTRNYPLTKRQIKKRKSLGVNSDIQLKLYKSTLKDQTWSEAKELPFNSEYLSMAHPSLSKDEKRLYFSSDIEGGYGQSDLYFVDIINDTLYGEITNLGSRINTSRKENFPFIDNDGQLFFSSDGHQSMGGLDVFRVSFYDNNEVWKISNLGSSLNSVYDDFAFYYNNEQKNGFLTSNRKGGLGDDDIYSFKNQSIWNKNCVQTIDFVIVDEDKKSIENVSIINQKTSLNTDDRGHASVKVICKSKPEYLISKKGYESQKIVLTEGVKKQIELKKIEPVIQKGDDIAVILKLNPIYFDLNKSTIKKVSQIELDKVVEFLNKNQDLNIKILSHTDSQGSDSYNLSLSKSRAKSTLAYLTNHGIAKHRLLSEGKGETMLINQCKNNVKCSKKEHELNRRSEFIITND